MLSVFSLLLGHLDVIKQPHAPVTTAETQSQRHAFFTPCDGLYLPVLNQNKAILHEVISCQGSGVSH